MSDPCTPYEPLIADALFGEITPEDRRRLEAHLATCEACADEVRTLEATLAITAQRERPAPPPSFWHGFWPRLVRRMERDAASVPTLVDRLAAWWQRLTPMPPALRWTLQGAFAVLLVAGGFWMGRQDAPPAPQPALLTAEEPSGAASSWLPAVQSNAVQQETMAPALTGIRDITYDVRDGTVEIRYNMTRDVVVRGTPSDPAIQQLLEAAMLNEQSPATRLNALQAVEHARPKANADLVQALTYLVQEETDPHMRLRAVRALRALHQETPLSATTRDVFINILLGDAASALRIEALQALMADAPSSAAAPDYLYEVQSDSNSYIRYRAQQALQNMYTAAAPIPSSN